jgi:hypothetical protein
MLRKALESTCEVPRFCVGSENQEEDSPSLSESEQYPCILRDALESTYENTIFCVCSENQGEDGPSLSEFALYMELAWVTSRPKWGQQHTKHWNFLQFSKSKLVAACIQLVGNQSAIEWWTVSHNQGH